MAPIEGCRACWPDELTGRSSAPPFLRGPSSKTTWTDLVTDVLGLVHVQPNVLSAVLHYWAAANHLNRHVLRLETEVNVKSSLKYLVEAEQ